VDIKGTIITIDAMGTQKAIAEQIIDGKADYVLALKGNQETLHQEVIHYIDEQSNNDFADVKVRRHITEESGHGRKEVRSYLQMPVPEELSGLALWKGLQSIGTATLACVRDGKETAETRYYISSLPVGVKQFAHAVRSHWGIENSRSAPHLLHPAAKATADQCSSVPGSGRPPRAGQRAGADLRAGLHPRLLRLLQGKKARTKAVAGRQWP
jgi:predicted transposase YbfD/YdcC